jgi:broad specificity phosphatase PhoE
MSVGNDGCDSERAATVWLVRHAETATPTLYHGAESDVELGEHGHRQAAAAVSWFAARQPTLVVSSAMKRAVQTAIPIAVGCAVPHRREPLLHERRIGHLSCKSREMGDEGWNQTVAQWIAGNTDFAHPGMESFDSIRDRTVPVVQHLAETHSRGRIVIVCHGVVCKVLLLTLLRGRTVADWHKLGRARNLAVSHLHFDGEGWIARELLVVPPPVEAINAKFEDGLAGKTEA